MDVEYLSASLEKKGTWRILDILRKEEAYVSELKEKADISNGTVQKRLKFLKEANLIKENSKLDEAGKPRKVYQITDKGKEISQTVFELAKSGN